MSMTGKGICYGDALPHWRAAVPKARVRVVVRVRVSRVRVMINVRIRFGDVIWNGDPSKWRTGIIRAG